MHKRNNETSARRRHEEKELGVMIENNLLEEYEELI